MADTPSPSSEKRCASCGAVLYEGAAWCSMCFAPVEPERGIDPSPEPAVAPETTTDTPAVASWPCPVCETRNPIDLDFCQTCGASFASLMRQETRVAVDPRAALRRSLVFPGLGHRMVPGRAVDGFARGVLFAMLLTATVLLGLSGVHAGAVLFLFLVYLAASALVYVVTASEAARLAEGGEPLVPSRALLWATVAILIMSIVVVAFVIGTAAKR